MTGLEITSILLGIILVSVYLTECLLELKVSKIYPISFVLWLVSHIALSLYTYTDTKEITSVSKSNPVYYLEQYKREDIILDKEAFDKLKSLGNGNSLYIHQDHWIITNQGEKILINREKYDKIIKNKETSIVIQYDTWGNQKILN